MLFEQYRAAGLCVIPLRDGVPAVKWGQYQQCLPPADVVAKWGNYNEYALVCGAASNVIAIDIDTDDDSIISSIYSFLPQSPVNKIGSKGFTAFYRYNGEKTKNWGGVVELLSDKHLTTLPPSKHRKKDIYYKWADDVELIGADLPYLPSDFYEFMESMYPTPERAVPSFHFDRLEYGDISLDDAERMLNFISPDIARDNWISVGMALRDEFGDLAHELFHNWSKGGKTYKAKDAEYVWRSFNKTGVTIGTIFHMAKLDGWRPAPIVRHDADTSAADAFISKLESKAGSVGKLEQENNAIAPQPSFDPLKLDGLIGDTVRWICSDAEFPQPMLALMHVLAFSGSVLGRRYASPINTRTNLYFAAIANTAAGKNHSRIKIPLLADAAGLNEFIGANGIISDTGVARSLMDKPCQLLMLDEWGLVLQAIGDKKAPTHVKKIKSMLMIMYSDSSGVYRHGDYANKKLNEPIEIHSPNLCIYGTTTEREYVKALTKDAVESGELNRVMAIKVPNVEPRRVAGVVPPPPELVERWERFAQGGYSLVTDGRVKLEPKIVSWGECDELQWQLLQEQQRAISSETATSSLWGRRRENAIKIAMIFSILRNKEVPEMRKSDFDIATAIVDGSIRYMSSLVTDGLAESDHEAAFIEILKYIKSSGKNGVARSHLTQRFRKFKLRDVNDTLASMLEQEVIEAFKDGSGGKRPSTFYRAV